MGRIAACGERTQRQIPATIRDLIGFRSNAGLFLSLLVVLHLGMTPGAIGEEPSKAPTSALEFIDTSIENASPLWYEVDADGVVLVHLIYDHERASPNRAAGHIHFKIVAKPGATLTLEFKNLDNVWNGRPGSVANELKSAVVSPDGRTWKPVALSALPGDRVRLTVTMPGPELHVARCEPYRLSDLDKWLDSIRGNPLVAIETIGQTVEGRPLEILRVGKEDAPYRVFLRARAHPWEPGGNWVLQGLVDRLLKGDAEAQKYLSNYCVYALPMANKDGVARGRTRFNLLGKDLNRNWDQPADPILAPENHALESWLEASIKAGKRPHLALELHNDGRGLLHISRPPVPDLARHLDRMKTLEELLRKESWFTEGSTSPEFRNAGTLGDGWLQRFGVDALVHELSCNWIAGLNDYPTAANWKLYGEQLAKVFHDYFDAVKP
ncbi:M14 family zinc carboxypeptidase [Paludisphaera rhizosphaerae]|uniref:M14 family zinc carboxypeptidase n=1 Tax=Paludisphaera rhizosphaerae TaxID=2711216 RepID=UPI0013EAF06F|nr:M14 family zinc carboxypeptidase [Paludisphaera rhizosphaerae]